MLQSLAVWVLRTYVGEYVENLNADQLSIGYGGVELENLLLKKNLFDKWKVPLVLLSGTIGKLKLVIPYGHPNTQPWVIKIEKLSLVIEVNAKERDDFDKAKEEAQKRKILEQLDSQLKTSLHSGQSNSWWSTSWWPSLYSSISTKIVENLQFEMTNVNIQFIDNDVADCTFGLTLATLSAQSTNIEWKKSSLPSDSLMKYKLVSLNDLAVYFRNTAYTNFTDLKDVQYILEPVSAVARIQRNSSKVSLGSRDGPRFYIEVLLESLSLSLIDKQYRVCCSLVEDLTRHYRSLQRNTVQPKVSVLNNAKTWWKYAIESIVKPFQEKKQKRSRLYLLKRVRDVNQYAKLYTNHLTNVPLAGNEKEIFESIEERMSTEEIVLLRKHIFAKTEKSERCRKESSKQLISTQSSTWSDWAMSFNPYWSTTAEQGPESIISEEEQKFLEDLKETYDHEEASLFNRDSMFALLDFTLSNGSLTLKSESSKTDVLDIQFKQASFSSEVRLKHKSWEWFASLGVLHIKNSVESNSCFPYLIWPKDNSVSSHNDGTITSFLSLRFGQKQHERNSVYKLSVVAQPLNVVYNAEFPAQLKDFFAIHEKSRYKLETSNISYQLHSAVNSRIEQIKKSTRSELVNVVEELMKGYTQEGDKWNIELNIAAPQIIIPLQNYSLSQITDTDDLREKILLINLGQITFCNEHANRNAFLNEDDDDDDDEFLTPSSSPPSEEEIAPALISEMVENLTVEEIRSKFYDSYTLELSMIQILVCDRQDNWIVSQNQGFGPNHVLDKFSVSFLFNRRTVFSSDPELPALTLSGVLPQLLVHIDEKKLQVLSRCVNMMTTTTSSVNLSQPASGTPLISSPSSVINRETLPEDFFNTDDLMVESKLLVAKFTFERLSLGLHSRGRCVAELQIGGVECELTKRPFDLSVSFVLSSVLLIDAMQPFGKEYELLVSSKLPLKQETLFHPEDNILMQITYHHINANCPSLGNSETTPVKIATLTVNSLHINGNLETIVELGNVINQVFPKKSTPFQPYAFADANVIDSDVEHSDEATIENKLQITADFRHLNILLFRTVLEDNAKAAQNVAEFSLHDLELSMSLADKQMYGSMRNLIVHDRTPTLLPHKCIFSLGETDKYTLNETKAIKFSYKEDQVKKLEVRMASVYYLHNPQFLREISLCAGDYKQYALNLALSLKVAASDMAKTIVSRHFSDMTFVEDYENNEDEFFSFTLHEESNKLPISVDVDIQTPVVLLPTNRTGQSLLVAHLGEIKAFNSYQLENTQTDDVSIECNNDRVTIEVLKANLSLLSLPLEITQSLHAGVQTKWSTVFKQYPQTQLIHNTDLFLCADKYSPVSVPLRQRLVLQGRINTPLCLFLSVSTYKQVLSALEYTSSAPKETPSPCTSSTVLPSILVTSSQQTPVLEESTGNHEMNLDINASFQVPRLQVELHGELKGSSRGFVNIQLDSFKCVYNSLPLPTIVVTLQSLNIEDMLHEKDDKFKYLLSTVQDKNRVGSKERSSSSFSRGLHLSSMQSLSKSLPSLSTPEEEEEEDSVIDEEQRHSRKGYCGPLVQITITLGKLDKDIGTESKCINVDIRNLDLVINLQTWVILLEFFGIGVQPVVSPKSSPTLEQCEFQEREVEDSSSQTHIKICFNSLVVFLNKEHYPLAKACIVEMRLQLCLENGNQDVLGSIGGVTLQDVSPASGFYKERICTKGSKTIDFTFLRYGKPDPMLQRDYDMKLHLSIPSIQYVHTQRFLIEFIAFCQHFVLLQEVLGRMRAVNMGSEVFAVFNRCARLKLNVTADTPILILPRCSGSRDSLVANLGNLQVENEFLYASNPKTNAYTFNASRSRSNLASPQKKAKDQLLDSIKISFSNMHVYSALYEPKQSTFTPQGNAMMNESCALNLTLERNLEWAFGRQVPDMSIAGSLSSVAILLDLAQFGLIVGMLTENLGEPLNEFAAPSTVLVDPLGLSSPTSQLWTTMHIKLKLSNVSLELDPQFSFGEQKNNNSAENKKLVRFDLLYSTFLYESFSDSSKSIELVSSDVLIHDVRRKDAFGILVPSGKGEKDYLQFQVHYLDTTDKTHITFLCNQSRILLVFDLILETWRFLSRKEENDFKEQNLKQAKPNTDKITYNPVVSQNLSPKKLANTNKYFELKVNITESELVVIEDVCDPDTRTVILKTTAVFAYRPNHHSEKPVSCSLQSLEVFSCKLSSPEVSALSIVDPVAFLVELKAVKNKESSDSKVMKHILQIQLQLPVYIRLSYYDIEMFMQLANSAKEQLALAFDGKKSNDDESMDTINPLQLENLMDLGFEQSDCVKAMIATRHNVSQAALWLTKNAQITMVQPKSPLVIGYEVKCNLASIILIDDCGNNDVPLLNFCLKDMLVRHNLEPSVHGSSKCHIDGNYYNTRVSAWEPVVEDWKFSMHWFNRTETKQPEKLTIKIHAAERLDMNLTSAFMETVKKTSTLWSTRFFDDALVKDKKRAPYLPFTLRNKTGCKLLMFTLQRSPSRIQVRYKQTDHRSDYIDNKYELANNEEVAFSFEQQSKLRHQTTNSLMVHQIIVQLVGMEKMAAVTVDRVGMFYRESTTNKSDVTAESTYVLFDIQLECSQKVITVKTALSISNQLYVPVELIAKHANKEYHLATIVSGGLYIVPMFMLLAYFYCRPINTNTEYEFCKESLQWEFFHGAEEKGVIYSCEAKHGMLDTFRFCAVLCCIGLPVTERVQPQHTITLKHHVLLQNQLPFDLFYILKDVTQKEMVKAGATTPFHVCDHLAPIYIGFTFENFPGYSMIRIQDEDVSFCVSTRLYDTNNKLLMLNVMVTSICCTLQISVFAPFWFLNKTGIPLLFKREDEEEEMAGQFEEHEEARSLTPLLFSFFQNDYSYQCQMRVGKSYQSNVGLQPIWSKPFSLEKDTDHRVLYARCGRHKPERTFDIGINISWGEGVCYRTRVVSFVPRFQFDNQTSWLITIAQKHLTLDDSGDEAHPDMLQCYPGAVSIFHWSRSDLDQIICLRIENRARCFWSGGISLNCETSYHLNMTFSQQCLNASIRVDIASQSGTYRCTITDGCKFPPPYKVVNKSGVALSYWQSLITNPEMHMTLKAHDWKAYVMHEPLLKHHITLSLYGETSETYDMRHSTNTLNKLYYQNAIYIAFSHTFDTGCSMHSCENTSEELVLEVAESKYVVLAVKVPHKPSQLWRMSANGKLIHFVSTKENYFVMDVDECHGDSRLMLNAPSELRNDTQTWFFESNTLVCCLQERVVRSQGALKKDRFVILGSAPSSPTEDVICCITRQNFRPGSGVLSVSIYTEGPTQVLEVVDAQQDETAWLVVERSHSNILRVAPTQCKPSTELIMSLVGGFGISVINLRPEELVFVSLSQIQLQYEFADHLQTFEFQVGHLQIDNQLFGCQCPVALFASPAKAAKGIQKESDMRLSVQVQRVADYDITVVKNFFLHICKLNVWLEDRLVLKLLQALKSFYADEVDSRERGAMEMEMGMHSSHRLDDFREDGKQKYFFERILMNQGDISMSLLVTSKIDDDLHDIKKAIGIPFVSFEDAVISFDAYERQAVYESKSALLTSVSAFYKETFKSQVAVLLGSLDILGNPMGFIHDFSSGMEGLVKRGNIGGLIVNVAHGFSDSAAKMTGVIADSLWSASMDNKFQESRDSLRVSRASSSSTHFSAGLKGLGMGVIGGLTSMVTQPIEGASKKGITGFFSGLGKGLVGTVTKPIAGVLDLASGTAAAVRMTTKSATPCPPPARLKRNCYGAGGVLSKWSRIAAEGQEVLLMFNDGNTNEMYVSMEPVRPTTDKFKALLTNRGVYFVKSGPACPENIVLHVEYSCFRGSSHYYEGGTHFIEIYFVRQSGGFRDPNHEDRTVVRCEGEKIALKISRKIEYLRSLYVEALSAVKAPS